MKTFAALATSLMILATAPASAQTAPAAPAATAAKHLNTSDSTIGELLADPAAKAILDKHMPGFSTNPQISVVKDATLLQIQSMAPAKVTNEMLAAVDADLAKLPAK